MIWTPDTLRQFEADTKDVFLAGKIWAPIYLCGGNEETLIKIFEEEVYQEDWVCSTYRSTYHALLHGLPPDWVKQEVLAGRNAYINSAQHRFITSSMVGGIMPVATGIALGIKRKEEREIKVWAFIGDMAWETGIAQDSVKYARNFDLPLNVVVECNRFSVNTPTDEVWGTFHDHDQDQDSHILRTLMEWTHGSVRRYCYNRVYPHLGAGKWVVFQ